MNKKEMISQLRNNLKTMKIDPDLRQAMTEALANEEKILDSNDTFTFDNVNCLAMCDGHCCIDPSLIRVTPVDIIRMHESNAYKDISREEFLKYFDLFLGGESLIPMGTVKMDTIKGLTIHPCKFIAKAFKIFLTGSKAVKKNGFVCSLEQDKKPIPCMLFPLGRISFFEEGETLCFLRDCPATTETNKTVKVSDFLKPFDIASAFNNKYIKEMSQVIMQLHEKIPYRNGVEQIITIFAEKIILAKNTPEIFEKMNEIATFVREHTFSTKMFLNDLQGLFKLILS